MNQFDCYRCRDMDGTVFDGHHEDYISSNNVVTMYGYCSDSSR